MPRTGEVAGETALAGVVFLVELGLVGVDLPRFGVFARDDFGVSARRTDGVLDASGVGLVTVFLRDRVLKAGETGSTIAALLHL